MSRPACPEEITGPEATHDQTTVAVPYEAVVDLVELLDFFAALCCHQQPAMDAAIAGLAGSHGHRAAALAARSATTAWALAATVWPDTAEGLTR
jgi:hypothetical protein